MWVKIYSNQLIWKRVENVKVLKAIIQSYLSFLNKLVFFQIFFYFNRRGPKPGAVVQAAAAAKQPSRGSPVPTMPAALLPSAASGAMPSIPPPQKSSQPSDAIQKAMEATLASIELPPPPQNIVATPVQEELPLYV